jgi:hypothetical protein
MPVLLNTNCQIDSSTTSKTKNLKGQGVQSIARIAVGTYKVSFDSNYKSLLSFNADFYSSTSGTTNVTALTPGVLYIIKSLGTTTQANWVTAGMPSYITAAVGVSFVASAVSVGTGTCAVNAPSNIQTVEIVGDPNTTISSGISGSLNGAATVSPYVIIKTLGATSSSDTTLIPIDPTDNSTLSLSFMLSNSSVAIKGQ